MTPERYDSWYGTPRERWIGEAEYRLVMRVLHPHPGSSVLDVGCGTGWFTRRLAAGGFPVVGLDRDAEALAFARAHGASHAGYVQGDGVRLPFPNRSFDIVISITALCFVEQWPRALAEIARVARRGFVLGLLNRHSLPWRDKGRGVATGAYQGAHWHTRSEVEGVLRELPVRNVRHAYGIFLPSGSPAAKAVERLTPSWLPVGSFLATAADAA